MKSAVARFVEKLVVGHAFFLRKRIEQGIELLIKREVERIKRVDACLHTAMRVRIQHLSKKRLLGIKIVICQPRRHMRSVGNITHRRGRETTLDKQAHRSIKQLAATLIRRLNRAHTRHAMPPCLPQPPKSGKQCTNPSVQ